MQIAGETFDVIKSDVLQGSKVILDVEEQGLDERTILALDAATKISSSGRTCFRSSDGKEHCFAYAQPGQCEEENSFGPEGHRQLKHILGISHEKPPIIKEAEEVFNDVVEVVVDVAGDAIDSMKDIALGPVYQAAVDINNNAMKLAKVADAAWDDIEAGAKIAAEGLMVGLEAVARAGVWLAEWVDSQKCELGMSFLLATLFAVNIVDPLPVGVAVSTTYLQGAAIAYLADPNNAATKKQVLIACDMVAEYYLEMIWTLSTVQRAIGESNKEALQDAIAMIVHKNFEKAAAAFTVQHSGAAIVAGVTVNLAARLVCYDQLPKGTAEWVSSITAKPTTTPTTAKPTTAKPTKKPTTLAPTTLAAGAVAANEAAVAANAEAAAANAEAAAAEAKAAEANAKRDAAPQDIALRIAAMTAKGEADVAKAKAKAANEKAAAANAAFAAYTALGFTAKPTAPPMTAKPTFPKKNHWS